MKIVMPNCTAVEAIEHIAALAFDQAERTLSRVHTVPGAKAKGKIQAEAQALRDFAAFLRSTVEVAS